MTMVIVSMIRGRGNGCFNDGTVTQSGKKWYAIAVTGGKAEHWSRSVALVCKRGEERGKAASAQIPGTSLPH